MTRFPFAALGPALAAALLLLCDPSASAQETEVRKAPEIKPSPKGVAVGQDLVYASPNGLDLRLDLYRPAAKAPDPLPVVIWVHGGGWKNGSRHKCKAAALVTRGFAIASIDYRLTDQAQWPAQLNDCRDAVRWIRDHAHEYGLAPERIGAWGSSAGGHLVALMGTGPLPKGETTSGAGHGAPLFQTNAIRAKISRFFHKEL